ncbi:MAG: hypothetical protein LBQ22_10920 [Bacteroidales bacterium]|jgi:hypothetical protein|nr:hypothetical protein [Bacteroidales bacterium]
MEKEQLYNISDSMMRYSQQIDEDRERARIFWEKIRKNKNIFSEISEKQSDENIVIIGNVAKI